MVNYAKPEMNYVSGLAEGVYADSGKKPGDDGWTATTEYRNHNSGSHSEVHIKATHSGKKEGNTVVMDFVVKDMRLEAIVDNGGATVSNVCETGFTLTRTGHFNPTDNIEFNIQITIKDSPYGGAAGVTGQDKPCTIYCYNVKAF